MNLSEIIKPEFVSVDVTVTSKKRALEELSKLLAANAKTVNEVEVLAALTNREKLGSTGLGHGVGIPHGRMQAVESPVGACIRLKHPVDFESHDGQTVDVIIGLLVPSAANEDHLKILAAIAEKLSDEKFCEDFRAAADAEAVHSLLVA